MKAEQEASIQSNQPGLSDLKSPLEPSRITKEAQPSPSTAGPDEKTVSIVTAPVPQVLSKNLSNDLSDAPEGLNLNTAILRLQSPPQGIQTGDQFILSVETQQVKDLFSAPFYLSYNPQQLEFMGLTEGEFLKQDKNPTAFIYAVDPERGQVIVGLTRLGEVGGISGSGRLALATFKAKGPGTASVVFQNVDFRDPRLEPVNVVIEGEELQVR